MDARTEHLIAMVKDGMTLEDAGRVYGISRERVRQILKEEGISANGIPGRAQKRRSTRSGPPRQPTLATEPLPSELPPGLAPVIEAMWREGVLYHEIAVVLDISCEAVHRVIRERVPTSERSAQASARLKDGRSSDERVLDGMRTATGSLGEVPGVGADDCGQAQAVIDPRLAAHSEQTEAAETSLPSELTGAADGASPSQRLSPADLRVELDRFKIDLQVGGLRHSTIHSYLLGSSLFVRWLAGDYVPGAARADRAPRREAEVSS